DACVFRAHAGGEIAFLERAKRLEQLARPESLHDWGVRSWGRFNFLRSHGPSAAPPKCLAPRILRDGSTDRLTVQYARRACRTPRVNDLRGVEPFYTYAFRLRRPLR